MSFAARFQRFLGVDLNAIPEEGREHLLRQGVKQCTAEYPCWLQDDGAACQCITRMRKWLAFWRLVRYDMEDAYPTLLVNGTTAPSIGPYHRPVFTHVCVCGKREEVYGFHGFRGMEGVVSPPGWYRITYFADGKGRPVSASAEYTARTREVCGKECAAVLTPRRWR